MVERSNRAKRLQGGTQGMERVYQAAAGHEGRAELRLEKMLKEMLSIDKAPVIPHSQVRELQMDVEEESRLEPSIEAADLPQTNAFNNHGSGAQNVQTGPGTQNNNNGAGCQITGQITGGVQLPGTQAVGAAEATGVAGTVQAVPAAPAARRRGPRPAKKDKEVAKGL